MNRKTFAAAFPHTVPVLMGYLSIGVVFGWMLSAAGFAPTWAALMSATIYAGSGQYLGVDLLANASPLGDAAFLTLMINFRHLVYGLSMLEKFQGMGWRIRITSKRPSSRSTLSRGRFTSPPTDTVLPTMP